MLHRGIIRVILSLGHIMRMSCDEHNMLLESPKREHRRLPDVSDVPLCYILAQKNQKKNLQSAVIALCDGEAYNAGIGELCALFLPGGQSVIKGGKHDLPRLRLCTKEEVKRRGDWHGTPHNFRSPPR